MSANIETPYTPPANNPDLSERECILNLLDSFASQRPGMEFANYGDIKAYRSESRSITRDLHQAQALLRQVALRPSITAEMLREAFRSFSGRLSYDPAKRSLEYCTGQYFPTEYRRAVCAVLTSVLWDYIRSDCPESVENKGGWIRAQARIAFGAAIAKRWFN